MKFTRVGASVAMAAIAALTLAACAGNETPAAAPGSADGAEALTGTLAASGASSQGTAQTSWIAGFQAVQPGIQINYAGGGSGAGRTDFTNGTSAFIGSDRAFKMEEIEAGGFGNCVDGTDLVDNGDGTWSVDTPAHALGALTPDLGHGVVSVVPLPRA